MSLVPYHEFAEFRQEVNERLTRLEEERDEREAPRPPPAKKPRLSHVLLFLDLGARKGIEFPPRLWCEITAAEAAVMDIDMEKDGELNEDVYYLSGDYTAVRCGVYWADIRARWDEKDGEEYTKMRDLVTGTLKQTLYYPKHWFHPDEEED
jgi:hypothetical protein